MSSAGQRLVAGRMPGERIATAITTSNSSTFTTSDQVLMEVDATVVAGRTYWITVHSAVDFSSMSSTSRCQIRIHEDSESGNQLQAKLIQESANTGSFGVPVNLQSRFVAATNEVKTFAFVAVRVQGDADLNLAAAANRPSFLCVDYIEG